MQKCRKYDTISNMTVSSENGFVVRELIDIPIRRFKPCSFTRASSRPRNDIRISVFSKRTRIGTSYKIQNQEQNQEHKTCFSGSGCLSRLHLFLAVLSMRFVGQWLVIHSPFIVLFKFIKTNPFRSQCSQSMLYIFNNQMIIIILLM